MPRGGGGGSVFIDERLDLLSVGVLPAELLDSDS